MITKHTKHDDTIDSVIERLDPNTYHQIEKNVEYHRPGNQDVAGEVDVMAFRAGNRQTYLLLFEIKSNDRDKGYRKAVRQLNGSERHYRRFADRIFKFYVTPNKDKTLNCKLVK